MNKTVREFIVQQHIDGRWMVIAIRDGAQQSITLHPSRRDAYENARRRHIRQKEAFLNLGDVAVEAQIEERKDGMFIFRTITRSDNRNFQPTVTMSFRLTPLEKETIEDMAYAQGVSASSLVRMAVSEFLKRER